MTEPADTLNDNILMDMTDSLITGAFSYLIVRVLSGKSASFKSIVNMNTAKEMVMSGGGVAVYRRAVRPMLNGALKQGGLDGVVL